MKPTKIKDDTWDKIKKLGCKIYVFGTCAPFLVIELPNGDKFAKVYDNLHCISRDISLLASCKNFAELAEFCIFNLMIGTELTIEG